MGECNTPNIPIHFFFDADWLILIGRRLLASTNHGVSYTQSGTGYRSRLSILG